MKSIYFLAILTLFASCAESKEEKAEVPPTVTFPEKAKDMTIYEVNIRQHTPEGTFKAFEKDLPRLKELGVDMLWIMPIQPIGIEGRKGTLGSYYSIRDYKSANPEFGTLDDFKKLVNRAHELGLHVILDWVPNHTSWDHVWITEHPEYYMTATQAQRLGKILGKDADYYKLKGMGELVYEADWSDIALLNFYNPDTRAAMIDAMKFWITETNIDGFRADHPTEEIPLFFWEEATEALDPLRDLFWLAERDEARVHITFHASYEWGLLGLIEDLGKGKEGINADVLQDHIANDMANFGMNAFRLNMITNHDRNSHDGTVFERFGEGVKAMAVFSFVSYGVPVLYSGQEVGLNKRLKFFDRDPIDWSDPDQYFPFYQKLNQIKADNPALWNGGYGGMPQKLNDGNEHVFATKRVNGNNTVIALINMSKDEQTITLDTKDMEGDYKDAFTGTAFQPGKMKLSPWQYIVLISN